MPAFDEDVDLLRGMKEALSVGALAAIKSSQEKISALGRAPNTNRSIRWNPVSAHLEYWDTAAKTWRSVPSL